MSLEALASRWLSALEPPPDLTVSEWAEAHRMLPEASAARGGHWRNATAPYLRGIMDAVHETGVKKLALKKAHQTGGSEALHNILGFHMEHDPCPMLFVHPTADVAQSFSKERLADMIRSTPALAAIVRDKAQRGQSESTLALKIFPGGFVALGGANTPNTFARWSVRLAMADDVDRFPATVGDEGDPADLLVNRTTSFYDALSIFVSTPTLKYGRIDTLYERSDQRRYHLPCPHCGRMDWVTWGDAKHFRVAYDERDPETARLECPKDIGCGGLITEPMRREMVARGEWIATATATDPGLAGFHLPAMISTLGDVSLSGLVAKWLSARSRGKEALRVFVNTSLGEAWEDRGARMEAHSLLSRRESYGDGVDVPMPAPCLTAGVDVQIDRFELQVVAWGPAGERWVVDYRKIPGDPKRPETQEALLEALRARYAHASGHMLPIHATCVDTGYLADEMYDLVLANQVRRIYATKGVPKRSGEPIVGKASAKSYGRRSRPVALYPVNVDDAKTEILSGLTVAAPGPGYMHFPFGSGVDEEYFAQLCAEHRETVYNRGGVATHTVWVQDRQRNEALDTAVLCLAALRIMNPNIRSMTDMLERTPLPEKRDASKPQAQEAPPKPQERRVSRSGFLGR